MAVLDDLIEWIGGGRGTGERTRVHYECRHCGTTLSKRDTTCPTCGSDEIAVIPL
ncbi:hypothetical protein [Natrinema salifodinae]|uniref:Zinc-ribbon domain-containing protein n=1 Tax=Natrinema salifodinae TaxID=1202768 RepID=A0A1I0M390_9EURY|nr:hypothetical protein [Natrinema salifodinae]SEV82618.1 hypothetical protein SAMN05216285_0383 [Natrinema salifodinae]